MDILIVYDSVFGHTGNIARAIEAGLAADHHHVTSLDVQTARKGPVAKHDLLIVGSPTRGYLPTPAIREFVAELEHPPAGTFACVFDTRLDLAAVKASLRWAVDIGGYAAPHLSRGLRDKGYTISGEEGFVVTGLQGPLRDGEVERAHNWGRALTHCDSVAGENHEGPTQS